MTINNPTETDAVLVRNPNEKYIRQLVWTPEIGDDGTPHVQAWLRLQRNQTMAFVKKLYPRAHFKPLTKEDYNENTYAYAQKDDETTAGNHVISINDPLPAVDTILYRVLERFWAARTEPISIRDLGEVEMLRGTQDVENTMVSERAGLEKLFISATYAKMKTRFYKQILNRLTTDKPAEIVLPTINADDNTRTETPGRVLGGQHEDEGSEDSDEEATYEEDSGPECTDEEGSSEGDEGDGGD